MAIQSVKATRSSTAHIRFATDILRRLGEELNPSPDQGILELVKNAYDANATECVVEIVDPQFENAHVSVRDDGDGMLRDEIKNGWLVLGKSSKQTSKRTRLGRLPAGSKGLGRLAALRMGRSATLTTRPRGDKQLQHSLTIPWDEFDEAELVDDVLLRIKTSPRSTKQHGTEITIRDLRTAIGRRDVTRLARAMILLADPFGDDPSGFEPRLVSPEFEDLEDLVKKRYFKQAEYHLTCAIDAHGRARASVVDWKGKALYKAGHAELAAERGRQRYECPEMKFDLWVFILNKASFETRNVSLKEVREWLNVFGGVHLYQNGLRVAPYGNPGNDWLDMNLRRAQSPEERPSTNTAIGRVRVTDTSELLVQKTDRSGFIESDAFQQIRCAAQDAMEWMARRRLEQAEKRRAAARAEAPKKSFRSKKSLDETIARAPKKIRDELERAAEAYDKSRDREVNQLRQEVQLYRTLSTAGITAATFAHESSGSPIKTITLSIKAIERRGKKELKRKYAELLQKPVMSIVRAIESLGVLGAATLRLLDHEKRRSSKVMVHDVLNDVLDTFQPFLASRQVDVEMHLSDSHPYLKATESAIESVITNLLNNSLAALEDSASKKRLIRVATELVDDDTLKLSVMDNGPGITNIAKRDIWLPGQTTRKAGTGLGLTIVKDTIKDLGGAVDVIEKSELGGAEFIIEIPLIGA